MPFMSPTRGAAPMRRPVVFVPVALVALVAVLVTVIGLLGSFTATNGGTIAVIRNGGWFDNRDCRQVVQPGSAITTTGWWSSEHDYPATQRNFVVSSAATADSNEVINVPSRDGVALGIEGTFYFDLTRDQPTLCQFDDKYGTRTYPTSDGGAKSAWDGDQGWNAFLSFTIGNLVQNDLRREVSGYSCADLIASCALAQNNAGTAAVAQHAVAGDEITKIQDAVNKSFQNDVTDTLGGAYFTNVHFTLAKVTLPGPVQDAINQAQAAFAGVTKSQAALQQAQIDAQANATRQQGYLTCPTCAQIDELHALPGGLTTYAPGAQYAIGGGK